MKTIASCRKHRPVLAASSLLFALLVPANALAQVVIAPATPQVGSSNPVTAEPPVTRPDTKPCIVTLLKEQEFADYSAQPLAYAPPAGCPGPWAKVVFTMDFTVTAGVQYDRTASIFLGDSNIFYGTTAEPGSTLSPSWHVERDVTDLSPVFKTSQAGQAIVYNIVNSTYTGIIYANAALEFYPASRRDPAPVVPDVVVPVSSGNNPGTLNTTTDGVTATLNLPRNVEKAYLDVISQSQSNDEFWYFCVPNDQTGALLSCGNTAFRETEITIDGKAAGVAPVYPWIFTGGLDPYLWIPITGVQTLNFKPYRVDLTPFAGVLADGEAHTVGISVYNANSYFLATGNLLVYTDHGRQQTSGALISNSLSAAPVPQVTENLVTDSSGTVTGTVSVGSNRTFSISGYVNTSHGRVETTVEQKVDFLSTQTFDVNASAGPDIQNAVQTSTVDSKTTTREGIFVQTAHQTLSYPLTLDYSYVINPDGTSAQVVTSNQQYLVNETNAFNGFPVYAKNVAEQVKSTDTLNFDASGNLTAAGDGNSSATYTSRDSLGNCYSRSLTAAKQVLTAVKDGQGCERR